MAFYRITYNEKYRFATLHNYGCTFHCSFCSYKLRSGADGRPGFAEPRPEKFLSVEEQKTALRNIDIDKLYFMGGEPTVAPELPDMLRFGKTELNVMTKLGHTNGSKLPLPYLDGANVGFKAWSDELHLQITGRPKSLIYDNFQRAFDSGMSMAANMVFIPGKVDLDELAGLVNFLAHLSPEIPFHIMGYIPVPGEPYRRPTPEELTAAQQLALSCLKQVAVSSLSSAEALDLTSRDDRFNVKIIAGV
ncbi:MAG: radical SAM protein [Lentisphaeria bacterium]|nr:radical SAM protein [Lentisphaeria bacterium]